MRRLTGTSADMFLIYMPTNRLLCAGASAPLRRSPSVQPSYIGKIVKNKYNWYIQTICTVNTFSKTQIYWKSKVFKGFISYYISNFHNSYFVYFVYVVYFGHLVRKGLPSSPRGCGLLSRGQGPRPRLLFQVLLPPAYSSASADENATTDCFLHQTLMQWHPLSTHPPDVLLRVSRQPAKSLSAYAVSSTRIY